MSLEDYFLSKVSQKEVAASVNSYEK